MKSTQFVLFSNSEEERSGQAMTNARVMIVDDHPLASEGLVLALRAALPGATVLSAGSIAEAVATLEGRTPPRLILLDYLLPDAHGFSGLLKLQHLAPAIPIVMISAREEPALVEAARALGAAGYLFKSQPLDEITRILTAILAGAVYFAATKIAGGSLADARGRIKNLSPAQRSVLMKLVDGCSNKEIATALGVTEATIKVHFTSIFRKLGVSNRTQALLAAKSLVAAAGN